MRARLLLREREREAWLSILLAAAAGDPDEIIAAGLAAVCQALGWQAGAACTLAEGGQPGAQVASYGDPVLVAQATRGPEWQETIQQVVSGGVICLEPDDGTMPRRCAVPLRTFHEVNGLMILLDPGPDAVCDAGVMTGLGVSLGLLVESERTQRRLALERRTRTDWWQAFLNGALGLAEADDEEGLLRRSVAFVMGTVRSDVGGLVMVDGDAMLMRVALQADGSASPVEGRRVPRGSGLSGAVIESGQAMVVNDYPTWPMAEAGARVMGLQAAAGAPLFLDGVIGGSLFVGMTSPEKRYDGEDLEKLSFLAQTIAAVLGRTQALQRLAALALVDERNRMARELHDGLAQDLAATLVRAELGRNLAAAGGGELVGVLDEVCEGIRMAIREARATIHSIRSTDLGGAGLSEALWVRALQFERQQGVRVHFAEHGVRRPMPSAEAQFALLQVVREALSNVRRHARAHAVHLNLDWEAQGGLRVTISDDGCGFDAGSLREPGWERVHFGLVAARERLQDAGGAVVVRSSPGSGTVVEATLPTQEPARRR
jgi:signal transduction histidine kinase